MTNSLSNSATNRSWVLKVFKHVVFLRNGRTYLNLLAAGGLGYGNELDPCIGNTEEGYGGYGDAGAVNRIPTGQEQRKLVHFLRCKGRRAYFNLRAANSLQGYGNASLDPNPSVTSLHNTEEGYDGYGVNRVQTYDQAQSNALRQGYEL